MTLFSTLCCKPAFPVRAVIRFLLLSLMALPTLAQTTWRGTTSTDWNTPANWSTNAVPTASDDVVITNAINVPTIGASTAAFARTVNLPSGGGVLTIASSATLTINGSKFISGINTAFYNESRVNNSGQLIIGNTASVGEYGIYNVGPFTNNAGGAIHIDNSTYMGLFNGSGGFTNAGGIDIGANAGVGSFGIYNQTAFTNSAGGQIQINRSTNTGLWSTGKYASFTNAGSIVIGGNGGVDRDALGTYGAATFTNQVCARVSLLTGSFYKYSANFIQQGLMTVNASVEHYNPGGFTNDGIIVYPQSTPIPNVANNKIIVLPITTTCGLASPALQIGSSNDLTVAPNWYQDANLTTPAGTYTYSSNTFTATNLPTAGSYTVYFAVTNPVTGCSQTVSLPLEQPSALASISPSSTTLTCTNPTATLTASGESTYLWSTGETSTAISVTAAGSYSVTATSATGCSTVASVVVSEDKTTPTAPALSGASRLVNTSTSALSLTGFVLAGANNTLNFYGSSGLLNPPTANITTAGIQTFSAVQTNLAGCTSPATVFSLTVVNSGMTQPPLSQSVCRNSRVVLTVSVPGAASYRWFETGQSASSQMNDKNGVQLGTATNSLTLVSAQSTSNYFCRVTLSNGSIQWLGQYNVTVNKKCSGRLGVESEETLQVRLFPNPVVDVLQLEVNGLSQPAQVRLYDIQGRTKGEWSMVPQAGKGQLRADVSALGEGLYIVEVATPKGVAHRQRVLKQR